MVLVRLALALWAGVQIAYLTLRGQVNPATSVFFVPDDDGWILQYPAVMNDPSWDIQPVTATQRHIRFFLWTRDNSRISRELVVDEPRILQTSYYAADRPTKILIHGFSSSVVTDFVSQARNAYLSVGDYNIIGVDWSQLARAPLYLSAATSTRDVGQTVAKFVDFLVREGTPLGNIHILGFSLGAHVAGWAGASVTVGKLSRITAFDPAYPGFDGPHARRRLSKYDANFVDVIHTNARTGRNQAVGFDAPLGHADFYPNGGSNQPGCLGWSIARTRCSHVRARLYFIESITNPIAFPAVSCSSYQSFLQGNCGDCSTLSSGCVYMGEYVSARASGLYYLTTRSTKPYSLN